MPILEYRLRGSRAQVIQRCNSRVPGIYGSKDPGVLWSKGARVESRVYRSDGPGVQGCVCWGFVGLWRVGLGSFGLG